MSHPAPPPIIEDPFTLYFWEGTKAGQLLIMRCQSCGYWVHLPKPVCRNCQSMDVAPEPVSGKGTVYSFTETHKAFHPYFVDKVPYLIAVIELAEQPHLHFQSNLVGITESDVRFGMPVQLEFAPFGDKTIPVFRPVGATDSEGTVA